MSVLFVKLHDEQMKKYVALVKEGGRWISPEPGRKTRVQKNGNGQIETLYVVHGLALFCYNDGEVMGKVGEGMDHFAVLVSGDKEVDWTTEQDNTRITMVHGSDAINRVILVSS